MIRSRDTLARMLAAATARQQRVGLHLPTHVRHQRGHEVPRAVDDRRVGRHGELGERPAGGQRCASAMPSSSHSACDVWPTPHASHHSPTRSNSRSRSRSVSIFEVADAVDPPVTGEHGGTDAERPRPGTAPDLVDADHDIVTEVPQPALERPGRGVLLRRRLGRPAAGHCPEARTPARPSEVVDPVSVGLKSADFHKQIRADLHERAPESTDQVAVASLLDGNHVGLPWFPITILNSLVSKWT